MLLTCHTWVSTVNLGDNDIWCENGAMLQWMQHRLSWNKKWILPVIWKCLWWIPMKCAGLWKHMVCQFPRLSPGVIWTDDLSSKPVFGQKQSNLCELVISKYWGWTTRMFRKDKNLICLQAIKVCPNVTPSYAVMRSNRRELWWICNESKPLPAYTEGWWAYGFFWGFFPSLPNVGFMGLYWISAQWWRFCLSIFSIGVLGLYFSVQSKMVPYALVSCTGLWGVFDGTARQCYDYLFLTVGRLWSTGYHVEPNGIILHVM